MILVILLFLLHPTLYLLRFPFVFPNQTYTNSLHLTWQWYIYLPVFCLYQTCCKKDKEIKSVKDEDLVMNPPKYKKSRPSPIEIPPNPLVSTPVDQPEIPKRIISDPSIQTIETVSSISH